MSSDRRISFNAKPEADVSITISRPVNDVNARCVEDERLHSYQVFDYALNGPLA